MWAIRVQISPKSATVTQGEGVKSPIHFHCVLHAEKKGRGGGEGVQIPCKNAYVLKGRPQGVK